LAVVLRHVKDIVILELGVDVVSVRKFGCIGRSSGTGSRELGLETDRISLGFTTLVKSEDLVSNEVGTDVSTGGTDDDEGLTLVPDQLEW